MDKHAKKFGAALAEQRKKLGLSQIEAGDRIGISNKTLSNVEAGVHWPSLPVYFKICRALDLPNPPLRNG